MRAAGNSPLGSKGEVLRKASFLPLAGVFMAGKFGVEKVAIRQLKEAEVCVLTHLSLPWSQESLAATHRIDVLGAEFLIRD